MRWSNGRAEVRLAIEERDGGLIARVAGELDADSAPALGSRLCDLLIEDGSLVVDLSRVPFCDASGAEALLVVRRQAALQGARLTLRHPHSSVLRVLRVCGLERDFRIQPHRFALPGEPWPAEPWPAERLSRLATALERALDISGSGRGNSQLLDLTGGSLAIVTHRGFGSGFRRYFEIVGDSDTSCGNAATELESFFVEDVFDSPVFAYGPSPDALSRAGVASVASVPVLLDGQVIGVVNTHRDRPGAWTDEEREALTRVGAGAPDG